VALACATAGASAQEPDEQKIQMADLPAAVKKSVREASKGAKLRGLSREVKEGKTYYEAELLADGRVRDVTFDADGKLVTIEQEVALESLPAAAQAAIRKGAGDGKITLVESITRNNKIEAYEAHVMVAGKEVEVKVTPDGKPIIEK
jgi:uncharacterized membrane protein YkoI